MKCFALVLLLSVAYAQQNPSTDVAVKLADPGYFQSGSSSFRSGEFTFGGPSFRSGLPQFNSGSNNFRFGSERQFGGDSRQGQRYSSSSQQFNQQQNFQNRRDQSQRFFQQSRNFNNQQQQQQQQRQFQEDSFQGQRSQLRSGSFDNAGFRQSAEFRSFSGNQNDRFQNSLPRTFSNNRDRVQVNLFSNENARNFQSGNSFVNSFASNTFNNQNQNQRFNSFSQSQTDRRAENRQSQNFNFGSFRSGNNNEAFGVFEPLNLPSGAQSRLGDVQTSFSCADRPYGYYADQDNSCRVFHVCNPVVFSDGRVETYQYSFMCGEGSQFDQDRMTCVNEFEALPCEQTSSFFFRNEEFGLSHEKF